MRLRVEYSDNGVDWNRASIVGDTLVGRGGYSGYLVGMLAVTGFRAESRPGGEVRFSWD